MTELWDSGEVNRQELIAQVSQAEKLNDRASGEFIIGEYRRLCSSHTLRGVKGAPGEFVYRQFAEDCLVEKLSFAQVIYGFKMWRRKNTSWAPTFGEFLHCIQQGKDDASSTMTAIWRFKGFVRAIIDPQYSKPVPAWVKKKEKPVKRPVSELYAEARDLLDKMEREKERGYFVKGDGSRGQWGQFGEIMLKGVKERVEMLEQKAGRAA